MKKNIYIILTLIISIILSSYVLSSNTYNKKSIYIRTSVNKITVVSMPSPPKTIIITDKDDIEKIVSLINESKFSKVKYDNVNGWTYNLTLEGSKTYNLYLLGDAINFNGSKYKVNNSVFKLQELESLLERSNNR